MHLPHRWYTPRTGIHTDRGSTGQEIDQDRKESRPSAAAPHIFLRGGREGNQLSRAQPARPAAPRLIDSKQRPAITSSHRDLTREGPRRQGKNGGVPRKPALLHDTPVSRTATLHSRVSTAILACGRGDCVPRWRTFVIPDTGRHEKHSTARNTRAYPSATVPCGELPTAHEKHALRNGSEVLVLTLSTHL